MTKKQMIFSALDEIDAENKMRQNTMRHIDAVNYLLKKFEITFGSANTLDYIYRKERGLI
jgi:hypothetical protein